MKKYSVTTNGRDGKTFQHHYDGSMHNPITADYPLIVKKMTYL